MGLLRNRRRDSSKPTIHIKGSFVTGTPEEERYVWINGEQYFLDEEFELKLYNVIWEYGKTTTVIGNGGSSIFPTSLQAITYFKIGNTLTKMFGWFEMCSNLIDISGLRYLDVSQVTDMQSVFASCTILEDISPLEDWNVANVQYLNGLFHKCSRLKDLTPLRNWDTHSVNDMTYVLSFMNELEDLSPIQNWNISSVTIMKYAFTVLTHLKIFNMNNWDFSNVKDFSNIFSGSILTNVTGSCHGIKDNLTLNPLSTMTSESAMVFINGLSDGVIGKTLTLKDTIYDSLTEEQIKVATDKGWIVQRI